MTVGAPLDRVAIDVLGELPETSNGNRYLIVISDYFTKWVQAHAVPDYTAYTTAEVFVREFATRMGLPRQLHTDQGGNFESTLFKGVCQLLGIHKTRTTPYHPQSDGLVERFNRTLLQMLKGLVDENRDDWDEHVPYVLMAYRSSPQESTQCSPYFMMYGREMTLPIDILVGTPPGSKRAYMCETEYTEWLRQTLQQAHAYARDKLQVAAQRQKNRYDASCL
jgi:transposase InsO family protein